MNCISAGSSVRGILRARILEWVAIPFSKVLSQLTDEIPVSSIAGGFFTIWATREAPFNLMDLFSAGHAFLQQRECPVLQDSYLEVGERERNVQRKMFLSPAQSCPTLCDPRYCSLPGSSVHGIFQARILEWAAISFSRGSAWPKDWTCISCNGKQILLPTEPFRKHRGKQREINDQNLTLLKTVARDTVGVLHINHFPFSFPFSFIP